MANAIVDYYKSNVKPMIAAKADPTTTPTPVTAPTAQQTIDYAAEINRIKGLDPNANVNSLIDSGLAKVNGNADLQAKYGTAWNDLAAKYRTPTAETDNANTNNTPIAPPNTATPDGFVKSIFDLNYASQSQKLKSDRDMRLAGLAGQDDLANQSAVNSLNSNDVTTARNSAAIREQLANLGLLQGGDYITRQTAENTSNEQNANMINQDRNNTLKNLLAQKNAINNNASADDLALLQSIQSQMGQAQLGQFNADRSYGLDVAGLTGNLNGQKTLGGQAQALAAQNQGFNQNLQTNQFNQGVKNDNFAQNMQTNQFAYQQARDAIGDKQYQQKFDQDVKQMGFENAIKQALAKNQISTDQAQIAISRQNANTSAFSASNSAKNMNADNLRQQSEFEAKQSDSSYNKAFTNLKSLYTFKDEDTGEIKVSNPTQLRAAILAKNLPDDATIQLLTDFGIPIKQ